MAFLKQHEFASSIAHKFHIESRVCHFQKLCLLKP